MAETSSLLRNHTHYAYRGFESLPLRHTTKGPYWRHPLHLVPGTWFTVSVRTDLGRARPGQPPHQRILNHNPGS